MITVETTFKLISRKNIGLKKKFCSAFFKIIESELDDGTETTYNLIKEQDGD